MTNDEKAKAYDEALERARKIHDEILDNELIGFPDQIREIFPELRENEDERVIKALEAFINQPEIADKITFEARIEWLSWLEKQQEQKPAEWSEEDEEMIKMILGDLEWERRNTTVDKDIRHYDEEIAWLKSLRPSWKPSDQDELMKSNMLEQAPN